MRLQLLLGLLQHLLRALRHNTTRDIDILSTLLQDTAGEDTRRLSIRGVLKQRE